ncbi:MAG: NeuD/PglB/VioB family sugar acetyltransferase [Phycisphaeraceae bacterium]
MNNAQPNSAPLNLPLIVIGAGGHARVLLDVLRSMGREVLMLTDHDPACHGKRIEGVLVQGGDEIVFKYAPDTVRLVNGIGSVALPATRQQVYERFTGEGYQFETLVHPSATVADSAQLGPGVQIMASATIQPGARLGQNVLVNTAASIDHDCVIGDHVHIAPGVTLSGNVTVGSTSHLGTGATVVQGICLGERVLVGAGAVVVRQIENDVTVMGVPARPVKRAATKSEPAKQTRPFNIMLSAAGRRVALLNLLRQSVEALGLTGHMLATDIARTSSAFQTAEFARIVPHYTDPHCLEQMLAICREFEIGLIVPTIDPDLVFYSRHRPRFEQAGTQVMISSPEAIRICNDKQATHDWLVKQDFPTMRQADAAAILNDHSDWRFPLFVKPRHGSSSQGAGLVRDLDELRVAVAPGDYIVQEVAKGQEYTVDTYVDRQGRCRCTVPRLRLETRAGEVSKGMTVRCEPVQALTRRIAEALPGARGVLNVQIFHDQETDTLRVCEINPRYGGGYPLAHQAGAPMAQWMIQEALDLPVDAEENQWTDGLVMLRYDAAVFVSKAEAGLASSHEQASAPAVRS